MNSKWYTVKVQSNREKSISERIKYEMDKAGTNTNIVVPTERVYFAKNGKKAHKEKIMYPGYIFVESESLPVLQEVLKVVPGNSGIIKDKSGNPSLLKSSEVDKLIKSSDKSKDEIDLDNFIHGENVSIIGGPFDKFKGTIEDINNEKGKVKVSVLIFGRPTIVDLTTEQITKIID